MNPRDSDATAADEIHNWTMLIEADVVMVSRKVPKEVLDVVGFFEWNRFCDRLDRGLVPLRRLAKAGSSKEHEENTAKAKSLQALQEACDKLSRRKTYLQFNIYCPFHSKLTENWHIQATATALPPPNSEADDPLLADSSAHSASPSDDANTERTDDDALPHAVSESASDTGEGTASEQDNEHDNAPETAVTTQPQPTAPTMQGSSYLRTSGLGVLGVDYIEHELRPTDTLNGLCLAYNITPSRLKQANLLSGDNDSLVLAPKVLAIPITDGFYSRKPDTESEDYKLNALMREIPKLGSKEAKAYLELADWVLEDALTTAKEDIEWEKGNNDDLL